MSIAVLRGLRAFEYNAGGAGRGRRPGMGRRSGGSHWMASRLRLVPIRTVCPTKHREQREVSHGAA